MKSVTEFWSVHLFKGLTTKEGLVTEGKTPEEIEQALGTSFKFEGDKLKHFVNALEVAGQNRDGLSRVLVVTLAEGEKAPAKAAQIGEAYYVPEFLIAPKPVVGKSDRKANSGPKKGKGRPKESPWGPIPEQAAPKAAKPAAKKEEGTPSN